MYYRTVRKNVFGLLSLSVHHDAERGFLLDRLAFPLTALLEIHGENYILESDLLLDNASMETFCSFHILLFRMVPVHTF